jgi:hypothetical protein
MIRFHLRTLFLTSFAVVLLVAGSLAPVTAQDATPANEGLTILPPDEDYGGASLGEWIARNWQWAVSLPQESNPNFDPTGATCGYGQSGPVFFLPASYTEEPPTDLTCVVPAGTALLVPVGGSECSTVEPPPFFGRDEAELAACAEAFTDTIVAMEATIDGEPMTDLEDYRTQSPLSTFWFPEDNFYGVPGGVANFVADGYAFIIAPPPPGEYAITVSTQFEGIEGPLAVTMTVVVTEPQIIEPEAAPEGSPEAATPVA